MTKHTIKLPRGVWEFSEDAQLGSPGGFGDVFRGKSSSGADVAVKRLKLTAGQAAHRELQIGARILERNLANVVPVLDAGQDTETDRYYLVMPICDMTLQEYIAKKGKIEPKEAVEILSLIVNGLSEVADIVHRDLKPSNILLHEGKWKIADFGIAKFVEDATSVATLRESLTPLYAAPEQWRGDRPTSATDICSLGCIAFAMVEGRPPFIGDVDYLRSAHIGEPPPAPASFPRKQSAFVLQMLRKVPDVRPTLARCREVFNSGEIEQEHASSSISALLNAVAVVANTEAAAEAKKQADLEQQKRRQELLQEAKASLHSVLTKLITQIVDVIADAQKLQKGELSFGMATLKVGLEPTPLDGSLRQYVSKSWDVIAYTSLQMLVGDKKKPSYSWASTLLFAKIEDATEFRWYEMGFHQSDTPPSAAPVALSVINPRVARHISARKRATFELAYGPLPMDGEDEDHFIDRWIGLFAKAATGVLKRPTELPIKF